MNKSLIAFAAAAFMVSAHAGGMGHGSAATSSGNWPQGATEVASQSSATRMVQPAQATVTADAGTSMRTSDTAAMGAPAAMQAPASSRMGSPEAASQSRAVRN